MRATLLAVLLLVAAGGAQAQRYVGYWTDDQGASATIDERDGEVEIVLNNGCRFAGRQTGEGRFSSRLRLDSLADRQCKISSARPAVEREPHKVTLEGTAAADGRTMEIVFTLPDRGRFRVPWTRGPIVHGAVLVPEEEGFPPPHPLEPSYLLFVYGFNLGDGRKATWIEAANANTSAFLNYYTLAEGPSAEMRLEPELERRLKDPQRYTSFAKEREEGRIRRAWERGWRLARLPMGPHARPPEGLLVRVEPVGRAAGGEHELIVRKVAHHKWTLPALPEKPQAYCPALLWRSVHEDFTYRRWIGWDRIADQVRLGPVESMHAELVHSSSETDASRLEVQLHTMPQLLGEERPARAVAFACRDDWPGMDRKKNNELRLAMVGEYYWSRRRLRDGILVTLQSLVALNKLKMMHCTVPPGLGFSSVERRPSNTPDSVIARVQCPDFALAPGVPAICQRLKQECRAEESYAEMIEQTDAVYSQWQAVDRLLRAKNAQIAGYRVPSVYVPPDAAARMAESFKKLTDERDQLEQAKKVLEGVNSWISQPAFQDAANGAYSSCAANPDAAGCRGLAPLACRAIQAQAGELEERLRGHLVEFRRALVCVEGAQGCDMDTDELRKTVAKAPPLAPLPEPPPGEGAARHLHERGVYANSQLEWANNRRKQRVIMDEIDGTLHDFYVTAALTAVTFGVGEAALAARAASTAVNATRTSLTVARALEVTSFALNLGTSANQLSNAVAECTAAFSDTTPLARVPFDTIRGPSCTAAEYTGPSIVRDYQSCVTKAVLLEVATGLLPMVPDALRRVADATVLSRARNLLNRVITPQEAELLATIFSRRFTRMAPEELAEVVSRLRAAGFKDDEIRKLIAGLVPDLKVLGNALVRGLPGTPGVSSPVRIAGEAHTAALSFLGGRTRLFICSGCGEPYAEFIESLLRSGLGTQQTKNRLTDLLSEIRRIEGAQLGEAAFAAEMRKITGEIDQLSRNNLFIRDAIAARKTIDPMAPYLRPGGGRAVMNGLREGVPPATYPMHLERLEKLIETGKLSPEAFSRASSALDEMLYLENLRRLDPSKVHPGDARRLETLANRVGAELRAAAGEGLSDDAVKALVERYQYARGRGETMAGAAMADLRHADVDIPRTTPELRQKVNSEPYYDPQRGKPLVANPPPAGGLEADHILPVSQIKDLEGYDKLDWFKRAEVLHNPENFSGLPGDLNKLKGDRTAEEFRKVMESRGGMSADYFQWLSNKQACMQALLAAQIACLRPLAADADYRRCRNPPGFTPAEHCR